MLAWKNADRGSMSSSMIGTRRRLASSRKSRLSRIGIVHPVGLWNVGFV